MRGWITRQDERTLNILAGVVGFFVGLPIAIGIAWFITERIG